MKPSLVVFLDDGGVMNDNTLRGPQWQRLVAAQRAEERTYSAIAKGS